MVSTIGFVGGITLSFAGMLRDFCWCDDSRSRAGRSMVVGGAVISVVSFAGLVASGVLLGTRAKRRRAIRVQLRDGALVW
ncbi:MAG: hypothetical protein AAGF92_08750 [Myxococcota bacterium]